jgi:hypothetical protein
MSAAAGLGVVEQLSVGFYHPCARLAAGNVS